jgi:AbrB family looped-hinge helix DNA binding protein
MKYNSYLIVSVILWRWKVNMANTVGTKGQVVIEKSIRERLGVEPGSLAIQRVVGDHVEIYLAPPAHRRSLKGILAPRVKRHVPPEEWDVAREEAWAREASEEYGTRVQNEKPRNRESRR